MEFALVAVIVMHSIACRFVCFDAVPCTFSAHASTGTGHADLVMSHIIGKSFVLIVYYSNHSCHVRKVPSIATIFYATLSHYDALIPHHSNTCALTSHYTICTSLFS
eukprot:3761-Heterococcus_DN1.PRE.2